MLQQQEAEDFVIATGVQYSVREFVELAAKEIGLQIRWSGTGLEERGLDSAGKCVVAIDPRYFRPTEVESLIGDASKARQKLGWVPKISFESLVREMARKDLQAAERIQLIRSHEESIGAKSVT